MAPKKPKASSAAIVKVFGSLAVECIEHVAYANYPERRAAALNALDAGYAAALKGDLAGIKAVKINSFTVKRKPASLPQGARLSPLTDGQRQAISDALKGKRL